MGKYHNFKLIKKIYAPKAVRIIGQAPMKNKFFYRCDNCDSEMTIYVEMSNEDFNRDVHKLYPHFMCLNEKDKPNVRV